MSMRLFKRIKHHIVPSQDNAYRPHILHRPWLVFFFVVILATEGFLVSGLIVRQSSQNFLAAVVPAEILALTNSERVDNNAGILIEDALLDKAAQAKADDMAAQGYFAHVGPDGKTPWQWISGSGYQYQYAGENLAVRFIDSSDVVNAWMDSPTHRANIVKPVYTQTGVGVAQGMFEGQSATYVVQYFASPLASGATVPKPLAASGAKVASASVSPAKTPPPVAVTALPASPQVEGASIEVVPQGNVSAPPPASLASNNLDSYVQSFLRQILRAFAEPLQTTNWILGLCATFLVIMISLTFFTHLQIQPTQMLMGGAFVALFALSLLGLNSRLGGGAGGTPRAPLAASPLEASATFGVVISPEGASTGYALFPQQ